MPEAGPAKLVLIVDNSIFIIERLLIILKEVKGIEKIVTATNYEEAVNILEEMKTDIVLLDIQLPGKNGIELLKYIVKNFPAINIIILSNLVSNYYQKLCLNLGANCFIDKSKDFDSIPDVIFSILN